MTAKENLQQQIKRVCEEYGEEFNYKLVVQLSQGGIHFFISAVLAGGVLFGVASPFGVAMVGASGAGLTGATALLGAAMGYLSLQGFAQGLRYVSACILVFAFRFCFYDIRWLSKPVVMAVVTTFISAITGFFYLSQGGWTPAEVIFYLAELAVNFICTWGFTIALMPLRFEARKLSLDAIGQRIAMIIFACALLVSLSGLMLWAEVSLGRIFAVVVILAFAWREGGGAGAILGLCAGISLDLSTFQQPLYAMAWGFSSMCAGFFQGKSRLHSGLAFLLANGTTVLWSFEEAGSFGILYEVLFGTILFVLIPVSWLSWCHVPDLVRTEEEIQEVLERQDMARVRKQLEASAMAFRMLGDTLKTAFRSPSNDNDVGVVFDRTAQRVCQKCYLRGTCWEKDYVSTFNSMNDASKYMLSRGKVLAEDFPPYFSHRCLQFPVFLEEVNHQLTAMLYRRQYNNRVRESRVAVCSQYKQISSLLEQASSQISVELTPQVKKAKKVRDYLQYLGVDASVTLSVNSQGLLQGEITGEETASLEQLQAVEDLSHLLEVPIRLTREEEMLYLHQLEPFMAIAGFASSKKEGESVCGDRSTYFKREDGKLFVMVCDGMGSGALARGESTLATELLEQFLRAGVDSLQALGILNSALALRGEDGGGFTTVDLLELNLVTAQGMLYKYGAAPTYYRRGREVRRIMGKSLPAGADFGEQNAPDQIKLKLEPEDCLLMVSDGVSGALEEDEWLCQLLQECSGGNLKEFSRQIIDKTPDGGKDDRTAVVVKLALREKE